MGRIRSIAIVERVDLSSTLPNSRQIAGLSPDPIAASSTGCHRKTLTVWFTDPSLEYVSEEAGDEVVLMKDRPGRVIGFEKLNFSVPESDSVHVALETAPA